MKKILVLGCTGSIGTSTLNIIRKFSQDFSVVGLTAHSSEEKLIELSKEFNAPYCLTGKTSVQQLEDFITASHADIAVNGIAGAAGLLPSVMVLKAGIDLALANKETIVMAGPLVEKLAQQHNCSIYPVDSEHSAVFTLVNKFGSASVKEVILTASGGPFRNTPKEKLAFMKPSDALKHPTWNMGQKITIDSASLANKGLEVIEACRLFKVKPEQVKVTIHPQSLIHSLIKTTDGVLYAQISPPDMRHPILTALMWPTFVPNSLEEFDITSEGTMTFTPPRFEDFPMLSLAYKALSMGESATIAYNAANEVAVSAFLKEQILFTDISSVTEKVLEQDWSMDVTSIQEVFSFDDRGRQLAQAAVETLQSQNSRGPQ